LAQLQQQSGVPEVLAPAAPPVPAGVPVVDQKAGPVEVQLAATVDQVSAEKKWSEFLGRVPQLVGSKKPEFLPAVVNGESIWRLRLGGFADRDSAAAFCAQVVAAGETCTVAGF
jgi:hypothetical protein